MTELLEIHVSIPVLKVTAHIPAKQEEQEKGEEELEKKKNGKKKKDRECVCFPVIYSFVNSLFMFIYFRDG